MVEEIDGVAKFGVYGALALKDRHRDLREEIHGDIIERPADELTFERGEIISPVSSGVPDADFLFQISDIPLSCYRNDNYTGLPGR